MPKYNDELYRDFTKNRTRGDSKLVPYLKLARWLPLGVHPFMSLQAVLVDIRAPEDESDEDLMDQYHIIINLEPKLEDFIVYLSKEMDELNRFIQLLEHTAKCAKTDDTSSLKDRILPYLLEDMNENMEPRIAPKSAKAARGFSHPVTARHLCGIKMLGTFDDDPDAFMNSVSEGKHKPCTKHWPSFLYDTDEIDPGDPTKGFMRGFLLLRVYRHIFTGPTSAISGHRKATKPSKSHIHGMKRVTGRLIAYAAVQARFALSSCEEWCTDDGNFNLWRFFDNIVAIFEQDPTNPWVVETLEWWDKNVPDLVESKKRKRSRREAVLPKDSDDDEAVGEMREAMQRAKKAQKSQVPRQPSPSCSPPASPRPQPAIVPSTPPPRQPSPSPTPSPLPARPQPRPIVKRRVQDSPPASEDDDDDTELRQGDNHQKKPRKSQPTEDEDEDRRERRMIQDRRERPQNKKAASSQKRSPVAKTQKARK